MISEGTISAVAFVAFVLLSTLGVVAKKRIRKASIRKDEEPEILRGEHLRVKQRIKELDLGIPPGTRLPEKHERK